MTENSIIDYLNFCIELFIKITTPRNESYSTKQLKKIRKDGFPMFSTESNESLVERETTEMDLECAIMAVEQSKRKKILEMWMSSFQERCSYLELLKLYEHPDNYINLSSQKITINRKIKRKNNINFFLTMFLCFGLPFIYFVLIILQVCHLFTVNNLSQIIGVLFIMPFIGYGFYLSFRLRPYILAKHLIKYYYCPR